MSETHDWTDRLSDYLNGDVSARERAELDAHLAECAGCRGVVADLTAVVARARGLPERQPERDLWPGIAAAIAAAPESADADDVIAFPGAGAARTERRRRRIVLSAPQVAAAAITLALASSLATWSLSRGDAGAGAPAPAPETQLVAVGSPDLPAGLGPELQALEAALARTAVQLDPETRRVIEKNLAVIERAIEDSLGALLVDPGNAFLEGHLERAYRRKVSYLRDATQLAAWTD